MFFNFDNAPVNAKEINNFNFDIAPVNAKEINNHVIKNLMKLVQLPDCIL